ncbi:hypothetical protein PR048_015298 [Dryococelus australis]|uniref:Uncharacterized protein n=1 Tax=Dryococelus australis TaxID=614101 RepID=A0ABQ9HGK7_9NEOP|nr:hypothetical protein PR048_015298 [Dryococelus australis]
MLKLPSVFFTATRPQKLGHKPTRSSVTHSATGFTPSKVSLGRDIPSPLLNISVAKIYDGDRLHNMYKVGDLVVCKQYVESKKAEYFSSKLVLPYHEPIKFIRFLGPVTVLMGDLTNGFVVMKAHLSQIKKFCYTSG